MWGQGGRTRDLSKKHQKTRCFFANMQNHVLACDSNHKKGSKKSSTINLIQQWAHSHWRSCFYLNNSAKGN